MDTLVCPLLAKRGAAETVEDAKRTERRTEEIVNFIVVMLQRMWVVKE
jgi:hypothetical protein